MADPWPKKKRGYGHEVEDTPVPTRTSAMSLWTGRKPPPNPMDVTEPWWEGSGDVTLPDGRVIRADRPIEPTRDERLRGWNTVLGAALPATAKAVRGEAKSITPVDLLFDVGTIATAGAGAVPGAFGRGAVRALGNAAMTAAPGIMAVDAAREGNVPAALLNTGFAALGGLGLRGSLKDPALRKGLQAGAKGARELAPQVGQAMQDIAAQGKPTLRPRLGITPGEVPAPTTREQIVQGLKDKEFFGTLDRLERGVISEEQAAGELSGTMKPKVAMPSAENPADVAARFKAQGMDRAESWSRWVQHTSLKPGMDAKHWYKIYDSVTPSMAPIPEAAIPNPPVPENVAGVAQPPATSPVQAIPEVPNVPPAGTPVAPDVAGAPPVPPKPPVRQAPTPPEPEFAGNIRLSKYPEELRAETKAWADANPEAITTARRGVRPDAQVLADAQSLVEEVGGDFAKIRKRWKPGDAWNAEEVTALRGLLRTKTDNLLKAREAAATTNSTENMLRLQEALLDRAATQEMLTGVTAEAGRALRSFRQQAFDAFKANDVEKMERLLKMVGGREKSEKVLKWLEKIDMDDPRSVAAFVRDITNPKMGDYITELFYNSILSGPKTHIVNSLTNTMNTIGSPVERGLAAAVEAPLSAAQKRARDRFFGEVNADFLGAMRGLPEGLRAFGYTVKNGISLEQASKWEFRPKAFRGKAGRVINMPSTLLEAADALYKQVNYRAAINATAYRQVARRGLKGQARVDAMADLLEQPSKVLMDEAGRIAENRLFRSEAGDFVQALMKARDTVSIGSVKPLRFVIPFLRTPANLLKYGLERSPMGWMNPKLWRNLAAKDPEAADQIARAALGSMTAVAIAWYALENKITGAAPTNPAERDRFYRDGKQPFSIRVGNRWVSYQRLEPFNQALGQAAAALDALKNNEKDAAGKVGQTVATIGQNFVSQTYMSGIADLMDLLAQPERYAGNSVNRIATALLTPMSSASRTAAQMIDRTVRRPETTADAFKVNIPGLSKQVPARQTVFGEDVVRQSPAWSPINVTPSQETPLTRELDRFKINIGFVGDTIGGEKLSPEMQRQYQTEAGQLTKQWLSKMLINPRYWKLPDDEREKLIEGTVRDARDFVREKYKPLTLPPKERGQMIISSPGYQELPYEARQQLLRAAVGAK